MFPSPMQYGQRYSMLVTYSLMAANVAVYVVLQIGGDAALLGAGADRLARSSPGPTGRYSRRCSCTSTSSTSAST